MINKMIAKWWSYRRLFVLIALLEVFNTFTLRGLTQAQVLLCAVVIEICVGIDLNTSKIKGV